MKPVLETPYGTLFENGPKILDYVLKDRSLFSQAYDALTAILRDHNIYSYQITINHGNMISDHGFDTRIVFSREVDVAKLTQPPPPPPPPKKSWADMVDEDEEEDRHQNASHT